ncbi:hypothetical protein VTJ04DRAFT_1373 [Mycothermus thermophilus]|uniref:uncharacterized protein n=1 Tax=Humicola insolens TaxID=85995 RepID=UPI00374340E6
MELSAKQVGINPDRRRAKYWRCDSRDWLRNVSDNAPRGAIACDAVESGGFRTRGGLGPEDPANVGSGGSSEPRGQE